MLSGRICVICNLGFVGVLLRICWICVFGFLSGVGRRTVCGENDGRIGVCTTFQVDCTALISYVCPCVHEQRRRSEYFSGEGWTLNKQNPGRRWCGKLMPKTIKRICWKAKSSIICIVILLPTLKAVGLYVLIDILIFGGKQKRVHWRELSPNGKLYLVLPPNWDVTRLYLKPPRRLFLS